MKTLNCLAAKEQAQNRWVDSKFLIYSSKSAWIILLLTGRTQIWASHLGRTERGDTVLQYYNTSFRTIHWREGCLERNCWSYIEATNLHPSMLSVFGLSGMKWLLSELMAQVLKLRWRKRLTAWWDNALMLDKLTSLAIQLDNLLPQDIHTPQTLGKYSWPRAHWSKLFSLVQGRIKSIPWKWAMPVLW